MTNISVEDWMHASDEEREKVRKSWDLEKGDGKEIVETVAGLFKDECVYNVAEVEVFQSDNEWLVGAYVDAQEYENLKDRTNIQFLGIKIAFKLRV